MKEDIYITGHKNPDTDSIVAAIAYADYKNGNKNINAIPVRLGSLNPETKFILDYFDVEAPKLLETVRLSVKDLNFDKVIPVSSDISLRMALNIMSKNNVNSLPVIDENEQLVGMSSITDIMQNYIEVWDNTILGKSDTSVDNIVETLSGKALFKPKNQRDISGKILVLSMEPNIIKKYIEDGDIVISGNREDSMKAALETNISLLIITGDEEVSDEILKIIEDKDISIINTPYDTFTTARLITQSIPLEYVMTNDNLVVFNNDDLVDDIKESMKQTRFRSYPVVDNNKKVVGLISRYHLISSVRKKVILVDHNERSQSIDGVDEAEILEIIDHHRVADVYTGNPIFFRNEPVGSTSTIISSIYFENGRRPSKKIAGILAAAIISDTLLLKSPTSTQVDKFMLDRLASIADINIEEFAKEMFKAGTSLSGKTPDELLSQDLKLFTIDDDKYAVAQVYTTDMESLEELKEGLIKAMEEKADYGGYSSFILLLTDIFKQASQIVAVGPNKDIVAKAFDKELVDYSFYAAGVLSRKKQVIPPITEMINKINNMI